MKRILFLVVLFSALMNPAASADEISDGGDGQGNIGGAAGGARFDEDAKGLEDALRQQGIITDGTQAPPSGGSGAPAEPEAVEPSTDTQQMPDGSTRKVTVNEDGSRLVELDNRPVEPRRLYQEYDKDGHLTHQYSVHSSGAIESMNYDPQTGVRENERIEADAAITKTVSQRDGSSTITQTGYGPAVITTTEDAQGHVTRTTEHMDGRKTVESFTRTGDVGYMDRGRPVTKTTTEYGAEGKPVSQVVETTVRSGESYRLTQREETEYNENGKPVKTTVTDGDLRYGQPVVLEEVEYWANGYRKVIKRRNREGEITEIYYYDELGNLNRTAISPGHQAGEPPVTGDWHGKGEEPQAAPAPEPEPGQRESVDLFGDSLGARKMGKAGAATGRDLAFEGNNFGGQQHPHDNYRQ